MYHVLERMCLRASMIFSLRRNYSRFACAFFRCHICNYGFLYLSYNIRQNDIQIHNTRTVLFLC